MKDLAHLLRRLRLDDIDDLPAKRVFVKSGIGERLFAFQIISPYRLLVDCLLRIALFESEIKELPADLNLRLPRPLGILSAHVKPEHR